MSEREGVLRRNIRVMVVVFVVGLVLSGLTAFPLVWEIKILARLFGGLSSSSSPYASAFRHWILTVRDGLVISDARYPFLFYGTDWLAFGHIVIGLAFIGVYRDPVRNIWIVEWGMLACVLVIPLAMICGPIRGIPFWWRLIDCSFGVFGILPLIMCRKFILELQGLAG